MVQVSVLFTDKVDPQAKFLALSCNLSYAKLGIWSQAGGGGIVWILTFFLSLFL